MDELKEAEIYNYRKIICISCDQLNKNCPDSHVWLCISMDFADKMGEES